MEFSSRCKIEGYCIPSIPITSGAIGAHHITMDILRKKTNKSFKDQAQGIWEWIQSFPADRVVFIAHKSDHDEPIFRRQMRESGFPIPDEYVFHDSQKLFKTYYPQLTHYNLGFMCEVLGVTNRRPHSSSGDVEALVDCLKLVAIRNNVHSLENLLIKLNEKSVLQQHGLPVLLQAFESNSMEDLKLYLSNVTVDNKKLLSKHLVTLPQYTRFKKEIRISGSSEFLTNQLLWLKSPSNHPKPQPKEKRKGNEATTSQKKRK